MARVWETLPRACEELKKMGVDFAVLTSTDHLTYITGIEMPTKTGLMFSLGRELPPAAAVIDVPGKRCILIAGEDYRAMIEAADSTLEVCYYTIFGNLNRVDYLQSFIEAYHRALKAVGCTPKAVVGIEKISLPCFMRDALGECVNITPAMEQARMIKTAGELLRLKRAAALLDIAQETFNRGMAQTGMTELELFAQIQHAMEAEAGSRLTVSGELVVGKRTCQVKWPGGPLAGTIKKGDSAILDISPRVGGYWGDCSNVAVCGGCATEKQLRYFEDVRQVFDQTVAMLRPGIRCCDLFEMIAQCYGERGNVLPHYCGHQIGVAPNELLTIASHDTTVLQRDMVICIELGLYEGSGGDTGVRLERMIQITQKGCEVLNRFPWGIRP